MITLHTFFSGLSDNWHDAINWPPDVFGLMACILQRTGGYLQVTSSWPPEGTLQDWSSNVRHLGHKWRRSISSGKVAGDILSHWTFIKDKSSSQIADLSKDRAFINTALTLSAIADEACAGIGFPKRSGADAWDTSIFDFFVSQDKKAHSVLSFARCLDARQIAIFPKIHTPRSGITIRSISRHLALCHAGEVTPRWIYPATQLTHKVEKRLNLLLVPWPRTVSPHEFQAVDLDSHRDLQVPRAFRFFKYAPEPSYDSDLFRSVLKNAKNIVSDVHGVIFPELALHGECLPMVWNDIKKHLGSSTFLIGGTMSGENAHPMAVNSAICYLPPPKPDMPDIIIEQRKHHRWLLTPSQVLQYGLSATLDPGNFWWEHSGVGPRTLEFVGINPSLTVAFLICEDLARQDPIGELIRSIGPNLVIGLLMDGPQLTSRWPARYATVLADDPGCSVLTLSSLGMVRLSRPLGRGESRSIALWKDSKNGPFEIDLPPDAGAIVLRLKLESEDEWTMDGRPAAQASGIVTDRFNSGHWLLESVHPVLLNP